jgi:predicted secreted protein
MAKPITLSYSKFIIYVGDGGAPELFTAPCGLTAKGLDFAAQANDVLVPDCDDPDAPAWLERATKSLSGKITGSGVLAVESFTIWRDWCLSGLPKNCRVQLIGTGLGYYAGSFLLTAFSLKANHGDKVTVDVTLDSNGQIVWVAV